MLSQFDKVQEVVARVVSGQTTVEQELAAPK